MKLHLVGNLVIKFQPHAINNCQNVKRNAKIYNGRANSTLTIAALLKQ